MRTIVTELGRQLAALEPQDHDFVSEDPYRLRVYGKDLWPRNLIQAREEELGPPRVDAVVWPQNIEALEKLVKESAVRGWQLFPYGAGSGVCGGATPAEKTSKTLRIVVDLKRIDRILDLDPISGVAHVQAGILGQVLEEALNQKGFTMGHFPSSIYCSSFGGYLATRAAGQLSTYYGKMEDIVVAIEGVLASGERFQTPVSPRCSIGPDWNQLFMGSEGTLAFLTSAWVKVHVLPKDRRFLAFRVTSTAEALEGIRSWLQCGLRPAAIRLYDEEESQLLHGIKSGVLLLAIPEGDPQFCEFTETRIRSLVADRTGWEDLGEEPSQHWWSHRYDVSYRQQQVMSHRRMILDTFEVSTVWSKLPELHRAVKAVTAQLKDSGMLVVLAHFSHFYHTGANIYFTIAGRADEDVATTKFYDEAWKAMLEACLQTGAAISHHHGIGRLKAEAYRRQQGALTSLYGKLKHAVDPKNLLNPENLGL